MCIGSLALTGCAARRISLPTDPGAPFPDFTQVHAEVSSNCSGVRTFTAVLGLSGRAGEQSLRGRVIAGFARPAAMRLEGASPVPFGGPVFVLAARDGTAVLWLPREDRVVRGAAPEEVLEALTGVSLAPADLQAVLTGCVVPAPRPAAGRLHGNGWASIDLDGGATIYLDRQGDRWRLRAARRDGWRIEYPAWPGAFPEQVRIQAERESPAVDLTAAIGQIAANDDIAASVFDVDVPSDATPLTLAELRAAGPLRAQQ